MRYLVILLGLCLVACNSQKSKQKIELNEVKIDSVKIEIPEGSLTKGEQDSLIMALSPYLEVDTTFAQNSNRNSQEFSKVMNGAGEFDENYMWRNIAHVDSVIRQCITYVEQNKPKQLLDLFNTEKLNIYTHPSNTIGHEKDLHYMILYLYQKYYRASNERLFTEKMVELYGYSFVHVMGLEAFGGYYHPDYIPLAKVLVDCYSEGLNDYEKAIEYQSEICERIEKEEAEGKASKSYGYELVKLATLYLANSDTVRADSCVQELRKNPYMAKYFQEHK